MFTKENYLKKEGELKSPDIIISRDTILIVIEDSLKNPGLLNKTVEHLHHSHQNK